MVEIFLGIDAPETNDQYNNSDFIFTYYIGSLLFNSADGFASDREQAKVEQ